ncbi:MAG TPA: GAP family protein [Thermoleophilaceae bacterium]|nr:GAP family protein [Thermoleophilaceae bacterium]
MSRVFLFAFTAMLNPTLLAATTLMLLLPSPKKLMLGYLLGALLTSITLGLVIVFSLQDSSAVDTAKRTVNPAVDLAVGALLLVVAFVLSRGRFERRHPKPDKGPSRWQRALGKGSARITFAVGVVLTLPGASYLASLTAISKLDYSTTETVLLVLLVNVIMLALLEVPLIGFYAAPEWTPVAVGRAKNWVSLHAQTIAVGGAAGVGSLLILRGVIELL